MDFGKRKREREADDDEDESEGDDASDEEMAMMRKDLNDQVLQNVALFAAVDDEKPPLLGYKPAAPPAATIIGPEPQHAKPSSSSSSLEFGEGVIPRQFFKPPVEPVKRVSPYIGLCTPSLDNLIQFLRPWDPPSGTAHKLLDWLRKKEEKRVAVMVGPVGCGKTTLAKCVAAANDHDVVCITPKDELNYFELCVSVVNRTNSRKRVLIINQIITDLESTDDPKHKHALSDRWKKFLSACGNKSPKTRIVVTLTDFNNPSNLSIFKFLKADCYVIGAYSRLLADYDVRRVSDVCMEAFIARGVPRTLFYLPTAQDKPLLGADLHRCLKARGGLDMRGALLQLSFEWVQKPRQQQPDFIPPIHNKCITHNNLAASPGALEEREQQRDFIPFIDNIFDATKYITHNNLVASPGALEACAAFDINPVTKLITSNLCGLSAVRTNPVDDKLTMALISDAFEAASLLDTRGPWCSSHNTLSQSFIANVSFNFQTKCFYKFEYDSGERDVARKCADVKDTLADLQSFYKGNSDPSCFNSWFYESVGAASYLTPQHVVELAKVRPELAALSALEVLIGASSKTKTAASKMPVVHCAAVGEVTPLTTASTKKGKKGGVKRRKGN